MTQKEQKVFDCHIFNGDYALELWKKCGCSGSDSLVWRETYLEGPLPLTNDLAYFRKVRADYLHQQITECVDIPLSVLCKSLQRMDDTLLTLPAEAELILWFDSCMYDQTLLMRILHLLYQRNADLPEICLYCCKGYCLDEQDFIKGKEHSVRLGLYDLQIASDAWNCFQRKDICGMLQLAEEKKFEKLPAMKKALFRCADEVPDQNGLSRTERQILKLVSDGAHSFVEIFTGLDSFEEFPFLGDTACLRLLNGLIRKNKLVCRRDLYELP